VALRKVFGILLAAAVLTAPVSAETAEPAAVADFYADRVVSLYIGYPAGGGYDVYGRLVANHIGRFLPGNPTVIPVNMEGAGSLRLANWLYNAAPRDGSAFGIVNHGVPFEPLLGSADFAQFDPIEFTWIGSTNDETVVCVAWHSANVASLDDLYEQEFIIGGTGPGADDFVFPKLLSGVLDVAYTALKVLTEAESRTRENGIARWLVGRTPEVLAVVKRSPLGRSLGREGMFHNLEQAVSSYLGASSATRPGAPEATGSG